MIIKGKLIKCKREVKEFTNKKGKSVTTDEKLFITLSEVDLSDEQMEAIQECFKDSGEKFTPDWVKEFEGYVNLSTRFELPARLYNGEGVVPTETPSVEDAITDGYKWLGADVRVSVNLKNEDGAIYPNCIVFDSEGSSVNAFAEFDKEEE